MLVKCTSTFYLTPDKMPVEPQRSRSRGRSQGQSRDGPSGRAVTAPSMKSSKGTSKARIKGIIDSTGFHAGGEMLPGGIVLDTDGSILDNQGYGYDRRGSIDTLDMSALSLSSTEDLHGFTMGKGITVLSGAKDDKIERALREAYSVAQAKAEEFRRLNNTATIQTSNNLAGIVQVKQAQRVYTAVSTLLYGTLSMTKTSSLEKFIRSKSAMLPLAVFDLEDWGTILQAAKNYRLAVSYEVQKLMGGEASMPTTEAGITTGCSYENGKGVPDGREMLAIQSRLHESQKSKVDVELRLQKVLVALEAAEKKCKDLEAEKVDRDKRLKTASKGAEEKSHKSEGKPDTLTSASAPAFQTLTQDSKKVAASVESMKKKVKDLEKSRESDLANAAALEQKLQVSMLSVSKLESERARLEGESKELRQRIESLEVSATSSASRLQETASADQETMQHLRQERVEIKDKLSAMEKINKDLDDRVVQSRRQNEVLEQDLDSTKKELAVAVSTTLALKEAASAAAAAAEKDATAAASSGEQSMESLQALVKRANLKVGSLEAEIKESEAKFTAVSDQVTKSTAELKAAHAETDTARKDMKELEQSLKAKEAELLTKVGALEGSVEQAQKELLGAQEALASENRKNDEKSSLLAAKIASQGESSGALASTISRLEDEATAQKEKYESELARLKKSSADTVISAAAVASLTSESAVREEMESSKRDLDEKLKQSQAERKEERERFETTIKELRQAQDAKSNSKEMAASPRVFHIDDQKAAQLQSEVDKLKTEVKDAKAKAEESANEWRKKVDTAQKQNADLRSRLAKTTSYENDGPDKEQQPRARPPVLSRKRSVGAMVIKSPSEKHRLEGDDGRSRPVKGKLDAVRRIQAAMRGSIERERLWHAANSVIANQAGLLVAIHGTHQGETGWYMKVGDDNMPSYFYFILDHGEFVMLCGPLTEPKFQEALFHDRDRKKKGNVHTSRSGVEGARAQLEHLTYMVSAKDKDVGDIRADLYAAKNDSEKREHALKKNFAKTLERERSIGESHSRKCVKLQESLHDLEKDNEMLLKRLQQKLEVVDEWGKFVEDTKATINSRDERRVIRAQCVIRSWLARRRLKRAAVALAAKRKGVMQALGKTRQGKSGWYLNPGGEIYYYTNRQGVWSRVVGPLSEKQYSLAIRENSKVVNNSKIYATGGAKGYDNEALGKTPFDLPKEISSNFNGKTQVYMGAKSESVYICVNAHDISQGDA